LSDHACLIAVSKDGGHTYAGWTQHDLGAEGAFQTRVLRHRMGVSRQFAIEVRVSSAYKRDLIAASFAAKIED
jgi:hypothetical protein